MNENGCPAMEIQRAIARLVVMGGIYPTKDGGC
jgi:hypothetical protein